MRVGLLLPTRDRLLAGAPATAPLLDLAAARTHLILLGTAVLLAPVRHPLLVLHQAATGAEHVVVGLIGDLPTRTDLDHLVDARNTLRVGPDRTATR